jgi:O-antigen/teichoic acid export membrane protein
LNRKRLILSKFGIDTLWLLLGQSSAMGAGLFLNIFIGYKYGTASLGIFNQSLAYYLILSKVFALGLNNTLIKKVSEKSRNNADENKLFTTNILVTLLVSASLSSLVIIVIRFSPNLLASDQLQNTLPVMLMALPFFSINKNFGAYYNGNRKQKSVAFQRIYRWTGLALLFFAGSLYQYSIDELMLSFLIVEGTLTLINITQNIKHFNFSISSKLMRESIIFGMGSYISEITSTFNSSIDIILVAYFLTEQEAGQYSFIAFFVRTLYVFPSILSQNISPIISNHWVRKTIEKLNIKLAKVRSINLIVLTAQLIALLVFYKLVILYLKEGFETTYMAFLIAIAGTFLFAQISWGGSILIMTERLKANFQRTLIVLLLNITVCSILTSTMGFMGSVTAISINAILSFLLLKTFVYKKTGVQLI